MTWAKIRATLQDATPDRLISLIKDLHDLSPQNKAFLQAACLPVGHDPKYLEDCRRKVIRAIYPETARFPGRPRFADAKKIITDYYKSTRDTRGTVDLRLAYVERGTQFTNDFGDIDEAFYIALENMLEQIVTELKRGLIGRELYDEFSPRLKRLRRNTHHIGWGYGDAVEEMLAELEQAL
ncbi:MAG: hypothetical protein ACT4QE_16300 [Anaerolineales bacterium]